MGRPTAAARRAAGHVAAAAREALPAAARACTGDLHDHTWQARASTPQPTSCEAEQHGRGGGSDAHPNGLLWRQLRVTAIAIASPAAGSSGGLSARAEAAETLVSKLVAVIAEFAALPNGRTLAWVCPLATTALQVRLRVSRPGAPGLHCCGSFARYQLCPLLVITGGRCQGPRSNTVEGTGAWPVLELLEERRGWRVLLCECGNTMHIERQCPTQCPPSLPPCCATAGTDTLLRWIPLILCVCAGS